MSVGLLRTRLARWQVRGFGSEGDVKVSLVLLLGEWGGGASMYEFLQIFLASSAHIEGLLNRLQWEGLLVVPLGGGGRAQVGP